MDVTMFNATGKVIQHHLQQKAAQNETAQNGWIEIPVRVKSLGDEVQTSDGHEVGAGKGRDELYSPGSIQLKHDDGQPACQYGQDENCVNHNRNILQRACNNRRQKRPAGRAGRLFHKQHLPGALNGARKPALVARGQTGIFAG